MADDASQLFTDAVAAHQAGRLDAAESHYRDLLRAQPAHADAAHFLGLLLCQLGRREEGEGLVEQSVALNPSAGHFRANLAEVLRSGGRARDAIDHARAAVRLAPANPDAHYSLGAALLAAGRPADAAGAFEAAIRLRRDHLPALAGLGSAWIALDRAGDAVNLLRQLVAAMPSHAEMRLDLGRALDATGQFEAAAGQFAEAARLRPGYAEAEHNLGRTLVSSGDVAGGLAAYQRAEAALPTLHEAGSSALMAMNYRDGLAPPADQRDAVQGAAPADVDLFAAHVDWARRHAPHDSAVSAGHANDRNPDRRLRVGYVSADFRHHSVALFLEPLLEHHDPDAVEVFCYSNVPRPDAKTTRFRALAHAWRDITGVPDAAAERMIRDDAMDLLIDLGGHTAGNRLRLFGRRPAPVQIAWLGWQHTSGLRSIGYRLTDERVDPPGPADALHTERLIRLPRVFATYRPVDPAPPVGPLPAMQNGGAVTFGSFAKLEKIGPEVLRAWSEVLRRMPGSRLLMVAPGLGETAARNRVLQALTSTGVPAERVELRGEVSFPEYLALHARVDLLLDTWPFNGHTTTCHAAWLGVPTLTRTGTRYASRMGLSVNACLGLDQFVVTTDEAFIECAVALAGDVNGLLEVRRTLRERMAASAVCDHAGLARAVEATYRGCWIEWCHAGPTRPT